MQLSPSTRVWTVRLLFAAAVGLAWLLVLRFVVHHSYCIYDDGYIYLRYARNLVRGCGLRFNCGDAPVEGFSGPFYLALTALGQRFLHDGELWTQILGGFTLASAITVTAATAARLFAQPEPCIRPALAALAVSVVLACDGYLLLNACSGMETALACLLVALLFRAAITRNTLAAGTIAILAFLTRPECLLFVLLLPLLPEARKPRVLVPVACALAVITLGRWLVFHDVLPNTYWAKAGGTARHAILGAQYIADVFRDFPLVALSPLALLVPATREATRYFLAVTLLWFLFFLRSGGDTFSYSRLAVPLVPVLTVLGLQGATAGLDRLRARAPLEMIGMGALAIAVSVRAILAHSLPETHGFPNVQRWADVGRFLGSHHANQTIATVPIGAISYFSDLRVIDLVGLTSRQIAHSGHSVPPELLQRNWIGHERHDTEWVLAQRPDIIVMTKWQATPWQLAETRAGFYAEWLLLREIKSGSIPYAICDAEIVPGVHWLMFCRTE